MLKLIRAASVFGLFLAAAVPSPAQSWNNVKALSMGREVRIVAGSRTISGPVQSVTDDSLVVNSGKGQEMFTRQEVTRVSVRTPGRRGRHVLIGAVIGGAAGAALGGVVAGACSGSICGGYGPAVVGGYGGAGALVGTLVGAAIPTGGWREVYRQ